ncbi:MAG TPA: tRNA pseudouridine(55) synthase TruB [Deltaproteobacteria bacterium]|nr:tRNA pseudouridine(55) synthase TruB [Deltaproteobacteria bacterium]HOM28582.1 tRNA pseudouridine(55) synthase TruB [Deltaproteobacteria bacterium]
MGSDGIVLIDKPAGITSRKAVDRVMAALGVKKAGHFGSLDPFATGLLCIGVGQGTKLLPFLQDHPKEYIALIGFERFTDTDDITGQVTASFEGVRVDPGGIRAWFDANRGTIRQVPPVYCAQKHLGKPMYKLKRANKEVSPRPKEVHLFETEILGCGDDWVEVRVVCSRGTYIRSIARDLGTHLGVGGYLRRLKRTKSEGFSLDDAHAIDALVALGDKAVIPLGEALNIPKARVTKVGAMGIRDGMPIQISWVKDDIEVAQGGLAALTDSEGSLLCIARIRREGGIWGYIERGFKVY